MRIVLDTNIYIAAALQGQLSEEIIQISITKNIFTLLVSEEILAELQKKLQNKFKWLDKDVDRFLLKIIKNAEIVEITENVTIVSRDPEDNKILECALSGKADLIVTADQDLIKLKTFKGIGIVHPKTLSWTFPKYFKKHKS